MKGRIDKNGRLEILRAGRYEVAYCPYTPDKFLITNYVQTGHARFCGNWCALFGEPRQTTQGTELELCSKTLVWEEFTDERQHKQGG